MVGEPEFESIHEQGGLIEQSVFMVILDLRPATHLFCRYGS